MSDIKDRQTFFKYSPTADPAEGYATVFVDPTDDLIKVRDHLGNVREFVPKDLVVDNLTSTDADRPLSANQGKVLQDGKEPADNTILKESDVEDGLNSTSVTKPLSANQGKVLQDNKEDADNTILKEGDVENTLTSTSTTKPLSANQGKQLNDDKASLSGGADANFTLMPFVGGNPIVERDSNDDGEFVRFADRTQICIAIHSVNFDGATGFSSRTIFNLPKSMLSSPYFGSVTLAEPLESQERDFAEGLLYRARDTQWEVATKSQATADARAANCSFISIGKW